MQTENYSWWRWLRMTVFAVTLLFGLQLWLFEGRIVWPFFFMPSSFFVVFYAFMWWMMRRQEVAWRIRSLERIARNEVTVTFIGWESQAVIDALEFTERNSIVADASIAAKARLLRAMGKEPDHGLRA